MFEKVKKLFCSHSDRTTEIKITADPILVSATTTCNNCGKFVPPFDRDSIEREMSNKLAHIMANPFSEGK